MLAVNYSTAREHFKSYCDKANNDCEPIVITRKVGGNVVMLSEDMYNNLIENMHVRSNTKTYNRLLESIEQVKAGKLKSRELLND